MTEQEKKELHKNTILNHIAYVRDLCYKMGIPRNGDEHDLSKFYLDEFEIYKYADGKRSPHDNARDKLGYSPSWCLHKNRNAHHWEHWLDSRDATPNGDGTFTMIVVPVKMPYEYVIEMFCDFVGAGKAYSKETWTVHSALNYWNAQCKNKRAMHKDSEELLVKLLNKLDMSESLDSFVVWYNNNNVELRQDCESTSSSAFEWTSNKDLELLEILKDCIYIKQTFSDTIVNDRYIIKINTPNVSANSDNLKWVKEVIENEK